MNFFELHFKELTIFIFLFVCFNLASTASAQSGCDIITLPQSSSIHPKQRRLAQPRNGTEAKTNPPALLWPSDESDNVRYSVRLSKHPDFTEALLKTNLSWAMFNPHRRLDSGAWYWQYKSMHSGSDGSWSDVFSFIISDSTFVYDTPSIEEFVSACKSKHPRILVSAEALSDFRIRVQDSEEASIIIKQAEQYIGTPIPKERDGIPLKRGENYMQNRKFAMWASKGLAYKVHEQTDMLVKAYVLTGSEEYGLEAIRRAINVAHWNPEGVTSHEVNNFANAACLHLMALVYDSCYDLLTREQKQLVQEVLILRMHQEIDGFINNLESRSFAGHNWQHIIAQCLDACIALAGEDIPDEIREMGRTPDISHWLTYLYELWVNRVPTLGGDDGGWANGNYYFRTNYHTLVHVPKMLQQLTGFDFLDMPWYRNIPYFLIYTWPPGSYAAGFGDGLDRIQTPPLETIAFADILSRELRDSYASWYVEQCLKHTDQSLLGNDELRWYRLLSAKEPPPPVNDFSLPLSRCFPDIGVVAMHHDIASVPDNCMVTLRSSPYAQTHGHMHADQNAFNLLYGGKPMFYSSGYYITMGDPHTVDWYRQTLAKNSVTINGQGQPRSGDSFGWIPRFLNQTHMSYAVGDASNAYQGTGLTRFRRHIVFLRPDIVVIYDVLEADHHAHWQWHLHSSNDILKHSQDILTSANEYGHAKAKVLGSVPLNLSIHTDFNPKPVNWKQSRDDQGHLITHADQYHVSAETNEKTETMRYLAIIQISDKHKSLDTYLHKSNQSFQINNWTIQAGLKRDEKPFLQITNIAQRTGLSYNSYLKMQGKVIHAGNNAQTVMVEFINDTPRIQCTSDQLPKAAEYMLKIEQNTN
ncbi:MAG: DUF4962 domain-containing protein [candidate division KSB1 bacterium]|nr:DUF4962 domain-containing protein [candidate division KSB1 bacterium]